jgi:hypothetical protein
MLMGLAPKLENGGTCLFPLVFEFEISWFD